MELLTDTLTAMPAPFQRTDPASQDNPMANSGRPHPPPKPHRKESSPSESAPNAGDAPVAG